MKTHPRALSRSFREPSTSQQPRLTPEHLWDSIGGQLIVTLLLLTPPAVEAQYAWTTNDDGTIRIAAYTGLGGAVMIPSALGGLPVTGIGGYAFAGNASLTSLTIGSGVTFIQDGAFWGCTGLTNISLPDSLVLIGFRTFSGCTGLTTVKIPDDVSCIPEGMFWGCTGLRSVTLGAGVTNIFLDLGPAIKPAFLGCTNLTSITVDPLNPAYSSLDGVLLNRTQDTLLAYPAGRNGSYIMPSSVIIVGSLAFKDSSGLTHVTIPDRVISIEFLAFSRCINVTNLTIPSSVTNIASEAFEDCIGLRGLYFVGNAPGNPVDLFDGADNVTVYFLPGASGWGSTFAGHPAILWNPHIQSSRVSIGGRVDGFSFGIVGTPGIPLVVEASSHLTNESWVALQTLTLTNGSFSFSDPEWANFRNRFYRIRSP